MGMLSSLRKSKTSLVAQVKKLQKGEYESDKRFLNYFDLKDGESMKVLFVPDTNGELYVSYKKHGPNLHYFDAQGKRQGIRGVKPIGVYPIDNDSPVMQHGYDLLNLEKETGQKFYREEAKKWFPKGYTVMTCIVLDAPMEVPHSDDGNDIKLFNVPYAVQNYIINQIVDEVITEEELWTTPFIIKKSKNTGGWVTYENSYFARKPLSDDEFEAIEESCKLIPFNFQDADFVPATPTIDELQEWLDNALVAYEKATGGNGDDLSNDEDDAPPVVATKKSTGTSLKDRIAKKATVVEEDEEDDLPFDNAPEEEPTPIKKRVVQDVVEEDEEEDVAPAKPSPLSERLAKLRKGA